MFYRRKLPHWQPDLTEPGFLFVTWRLAGSIARTQLPIGKGLSAGHAFLALDREVDKATTGPVWLQDARIARLVAEALLYGESGRQFYRFRAWVIMPNHAHVVLQPKVPMPTITRWLKGSTARHANVILGRTGWRSGRTNHSIIAGAMRRSWNVSCVMLSTTR